MAEMLGALVSVGGAIAGGKAAQAVMGNGGGGGASQTPVAKVDPSKAIEYFQQAAAAEKQGYDLGIGYYGNSLNEAAGQVTAGYNAANGQLQSLSNASNNALNEELRMMGIDPTQATAGYGAAIRGVLAIGSGANGQPNGANTSNFYSPEVTSYANNLANLMDQASAERDPTQRAADKAHILDTINNASTNINASLTSQLANTKAALADMQKNQTPQSGYTALLMNGEHPLASGYGFTSSLDPHTNSLIELAGYGIPISAIQSGKPGDLQGLQDLRNYLGNQYNQQQQAPLLAQINSIQGNIDNNNQKIASLNGNYASQFSQNYGTNYDAGYTGQQISDKVAQLPGYQFELSQGLQSLNRQAAQQGMSLSGNASIAAQELGQNQALKYYQQNLNNLSVIQQQGAGATAQISANQINLGNALGQLSTMYGQAMMDTQRAEADYKAYTLMQSGFVTNQDNMFNAQQTNQAVDNAVKNNIAQQNANTNRQNANQNGQYQQGQLGLAQQQFQQQSNNSNNAAAGYLYGSAF